MFKTRNLGAPLAGFALVLGLSVMPGLAKQVGASQANPQSIQAQQPVMSMAQMMQQMHQIMGETSGMTHQMNGMYGQRGQGMGMGQSQG
jgi:hypothetical protein